MKSISDPKVVNHVRIEDRKVIDRMMKRIAEIPANGDKMKSFSSDTEQIDLTFHCSDKRQKVQIFSKRFKTPSTGFNSADLNGVEGKLYQDIDALLDPSFKKVTPKVKGLELQFGNLTITYMGGESKSMANSTASIVLETYTIKDRQNKNQTLEIIYGQLPPRPVVFTVDQEKFTIVTYETKEQQRLYPDYFQVLK